jgi:hypothetical protein
MQRLNWSQILRKAKKYRADIDAEDARKAKLEPGFDQDYSYRKGSKICIMTSEAKIARKYRKDTLKAPQPWD